MDNQIQKHSDEIDLLELFNRMGKAIKNFFIWVANLFKSFLLLLIRKSIWILSFAVIGVFCGYYVFNNTPRLYSSEMVARSNAINNSFIVNSINLLNELCENKNYTALGDYLGVTSEEAKKIKSIGAFYGVDVNRDKIVDFIDYNNQYNPKDTTQKRLSDVFYLKIKVSDEAIFPNVRDGIKKHISSNPYIQQNNTLRKQQAVNLIKEISILDSLQKELYFDVPKIQRSGNNQTVLLNDKLSNLYHKDLIDLYKKKQDLEKDLALNPEPITVIQDFSLLSKIENSLIKILKSWVIFFGIFGFVLSIIWEFRIKIWTMIMNK